MRVVFVVGPTASGKSAFALTAAEKHRGVIVNCDSVQVYRDLDIGAAKPTRTEMARVPHHLFGYVPAPEVLTAGKFARTYKEKLEALEVEAVFTVGGTGFYFQAIEKGMPEFPPSETVRKERIRAELECDGNDKTWARLEALDPVAAAKIEPNDSYRLIRALEIIEASGRTVTELNEEHERSHAKFPWPLQKVGLWPSRVRERKQVEKRAAAMLQQGLIEETRELLERGLADWSPLQSVGYRETAEYLRGNISGVAELHDKIVNSTMYLAKRQRTWFQRDKEIQWIDPDEPGALETFLSLTNAQARKTI